MPYGGQTDEYFQKNGLVRFVTEESSFEMVLAKTIYFLG